MIKLLEKTKVAVIGDVHEHFDIFQSLLEKIQPSTNLLVVSLGDLFDKGFGFKDGFKCLLKVKELHDQRIGYFIMGNHDFKTIKKQKKRGIELPEEMLWMDTQPRALTFEFSNNTLLTCVHGGVTPKMEWKHLETNAIDLMYVRDINPITGNYIGLKWVDGKLEPREPGGIPWAEKYDGRFGHIISGHDPQYDGKPKYFPHATLIDTGVFKTGILSCIIFDENGNKELIQEKGNCRNWDL